VSLAEGPLHQAADRERSVQRLGPFDRHGGPGLAGGLGQGEGMVAVRAVERPVAGVQPAQSLVQVLRRLGIPARLQQRAAPLAEQPELRIRPDDALFQDCQPFGGSGFEGRPHEPRPFHRIREPGRGLRQLLRRRQVPGQERSLGPK
jgi:hypothetical protein